MRPFLLGLTGSIGMGKSTTAKMFADLGCDVWDADAAVHRLYASGGKAVEPLAKLHPPAAVNGAIDRAKLKNWIESDPEALAKIEGIVHPLVAEDRADFIASSKSDIVVLDIPLLFETGSADRFDAVAVVSVDPETQRARVLDRQGMTEDMFRRILERQMPDREKRALADHVIETRTLDSARADVQTLVNQIRAGRRDA